MKKKKIDLTLGKKLFIVEHSSPFASNPKTYFLEGEIIESKKTVSKIIAKPHFSDEHLKDDYEKKLKIKHSNLETQDDGYSSLKSSYVVYESYEDYLSEKKEKESYSKELQDVKSLFDNLLASDVPLSEIKQALSNLN